jgi:hypothetical protein
MVQMGSLATEERRSANGRQAWIPPKEHEQHGLEAARDLNLQWNVAGRGHRACQEEGNLATCWSWILVSRILCIIFKLDILNENYLIIEALDASFGYAQVHSYTA